MATAPDYCEVTVKRPNGTLEIIKVPGRAELCDAAFAIMKKATKAAGRGDLVSYKNVTRQIADYVMTAADKTNQAYDNRVKAIANLSATGK